MQNSGEFLLLINSDGSLEVAIREGSAAKELGVGIGAGVRVKIGPEWVRKRKPIP